MMLNIFNKTVFKILLLFSASPGRNLNRNVIKGLIKANNIVLDKALTTLLNEEILVKKKRMYSINFENEIGLQVLDLITKEYDLFKKIPFKIMFSIIDLAEIFDNKTTNQCLLFGSYSKLNFTENSDIDVAVLSDKNITKEKKQKIRKIEEKYETTIQLHHFKTAEFYKNKKDPLINDIIKNNVRIR